MQNDTYFLIRNLVLGRYYKRVGLTGFRTTRWYNATFFPTIKAAQDWLHSQGLANVEVDIQVVGRIPTQRLAAQLHGRPDWA